MADAPWPDAGPNTGTDPRMLVHANEIVQAINRLVIAQQGPTGPAGEPGTPGASGVGVPAGGVPGQVLAKSSSADYATAWIDNADAIEFVFDGGGATLTPGVKGFLEVPFGCTIKRWTLVAAQVGSIVIDVWADSYANFPPTAGDSICGSDRPTLAGTQKGQGTTLTGWTVDLAEGMILAFNIVSASVQSATLSLKVAKGVT
jgi:hypothetical protein